MAGDGDVVTTVLVGTYRVAEIWCREHEMNPRDRNVIIVSGDVHSSFKLMGRRGSFNIWYLYGHKVSMEFFYAVSHLRATGDVAEHWVQEHGIWHEKTRRTVGWLEKLPGSVREGGHQERDAEEGGAESQETDPGDGGVEGGGHEADEGHEEHEEIQGSGHVGQYAPGWNVACPACLRWVRIRKDGCLPLHRSYVPLGTGRRFYHCKFSEYDARTVAVRVSQWTPEQIRRRDVTKQLNETE